MKAKPLRVEKFLDEMDVVVPWSDLVSEIKPHYPSGQLGGPAHNFQLMLRIHFFQLWHNLRDPGDILLLFENPKI